MNDIEAPRDAHDQNTDRNGLDEESRLDKDLQETFPASDAPSTGGATKIGSDGKEVGVSKD